MRTLGPLTRPLGPVSVKPAKAGATREDPQALYWPQLLQVLGEGLARIKEASTRPEIDWDATVAKLVAAIKASRTEPVVWEHEIIRNQDGSSKRVISRPKLK